VINLTPLIRTGYRVGVPFGGSWTEILNSDADLYGGSGAGNYGEVAADAEPAHGKPFSLSLTLPPLSAVVFEATSPAEPAVQPAPAETPPAPAS
jgi:1,4-alpha-glucan branching enzyme